MNQGDLIDIYSTKENMFFFPCAYKTFTKTHHIPGYTRHLNKFKKNQVIWGLFSEHNEINLEISNWKISEKSPNIWDRSVHFLMSALALGALLVNGTGTGSFPSATSSVRGAWHCSFPCLWLESPVHSWVRSLLFRHANQTVALSVPRWGKAKCEGMNLCEAKPGMNSLVSRDITRVNMCKTFRRLLRRWGDFRM